MDKDATKIKVDATSSSSSGAWLLADKLALRAADLALLGADKSKFIVYREKTFLLFLFVCSTLHFSSEQTLLLASHSPSPMKDDIKV